MAVALPPLPPSYAQGLALIDEAHAEDPNKVDGPDGPQSLPYELHYARKMTKWLEARCPSASPELQLACRAQHFKRYVKPADDAAYKVCLARSRRRTLPAGGRSPGPASP